MRNQLLLTSPKHYVSPIIKVVGQRCNLKCTYCFFNKKNQSSDSLLNLLLVEKLINGYNSIYNNREMPFLWHGGEPLLAGVDYFSKVIALQSKYCTNNQIKNRIQTNATLINEEWACFLKENKFGVGVSIDGPEAIHNVTRVYPNGKGSFDSVLRGIEYLKKADINPGVIVTITKSNIRRLSELLDLLVSSMGLNKIGFNVFLYNDSQSQDHLSSNSVDNEELIIFYKELFAYWITKKDKNLSFRELDQFLLGVLGKFPQVCTLNGTCSSFISVDWNGDVYPCERLMEKQNYLGSLKELSLLELLNGDSRYNFAERVRDYPEECVSCEWFANCRNGCTHHRRKNKNFYCKVNKTLFSLIKTFFAETKNHS